MRAASGAASRSPVAEHLRGLARGLAADGSEGPAANSSACGTRHRNDEVEAVEEGA